MKTYMLNSRQWYLQAEKYSDLFEDFHGFFLTGWQRYDHFASLCELMPVSMASLAINIRLIRSYVMTESEVEMIMRTLKCPSTTDLNMLISGNDKCHFAGYKVRDSIRDFILLKQEYDNATWIHRREAAYLQRSQIHLNASNPFYVDAIRDSYQKCLIRLDKILDQLRSSMNDLFYEDVFMEFVTDYISPFYDRLKERLASVEIIDTKKTYRARPWFRR
ncbi:hypothetical protein KIN20_011700 [Parelaphostrongylus tenuis]|uniref:Uncharacterized protein n=1 Tax=Parelaphostrongylus tenuis TaxID=148309 RepID=A0AAD5QMA0_PARTN|nr:hypothetical protein KIN20_011700 [Parelaphostrongylus tenuis]